ncbi:hypothetical protein [Komagataeibacter xylinus]|uniref:hypothetical protein n=1 Tax=Komagataeibacter xylinus TaxID=28448 RepID=UPI001F5E8DDD|nr:hypothetical protein [Komagataeibacter xylinus]
MPAGISPYQACQRGSQTGRGPSRLGSMAQCGPSCKGLAFIPLTGGVDGDKEKRHMNSQLP